MSDKNHPEIPGLDIDEESIRRVNELFGDMDILPSKKDRSKEPDTNSSPKKPRAKLKEPLPLSIDEENFAVRMAKKELQKFHSSFIDFTESVDDTMLYAYVSEDVYRLSEAFNDMERLIKKEIDTSKLTDAGREHYETMLVIRKRILNDMYYKYTKDS